MKYTNYVLVICLIYLHPSIFIYRFTKVKKMSSVDWALFFRDAGISPAEANNYADAFVKNNIGCDLVEHLDKSHLQDMGIKALGDIMRIKMNAKKENVARYMTPILFPIPLLSSKKEAENEKIVDDIDNEIGDENIDKLSDEEESETPAADTANDVETTKTKADDTAGA